MKPLPFLASLVLIFGFWGCTPPPVSPLTPSPKLTAAANHGFDSLEKLDGEALGALVWKPETRITGLDATAVRKIVEGPGRRYLSAYTPIQGKVVETMNPSQLEISRTYRLPDGRKRGLSLIATGTTDPKVTPLSLSLFVALGNAEQRDGENHFRAWRRMLKKHRAEFESAGWKGVLNSSDFEDFRTWDQMESYLDEQADQLDAKHRHPTSP